MSIHFFSTNHAFCYFCYTTKYQRFWRVLHFCRMAQTVFFSNICIWHRFSIQSDGIFRALVDRAKNDIGYPIKSATLSTLDQPLLLLCWILYRLSINLCVCCDEDAISWLVRHKNWIERISVNDVTFVSFCSRCFPLLFFCCFYRFVEEKIGVKRIDTKEIEKIVFFLRVFILEQFVMSFESVDASTYILLLQSSSTFFCLSSFFLLFLCYFLSSPSLLLLYLYFSSFSPPSIVRFHNFKCHVRSSFGTLTVMVTRAHT